VILEEMKLDFHMDFMQTPEYSLLHQYKKPIVEKETNLPVVEEANAAGTVAESYAYFREHFGRQDIPGILKCFATHPPLLQQMMEVASTLLFCEGHLTRRVKEEIATYVSSLNRCPYCVDSHAFFLHVHGGSDTLVNALATADAEHAPVDEKERILLQFVHKVNCDSYKVSPEDVAGLRDAGWNEPQIAEAVHITALFACFNRVANSFGLPSQQLLDLRSETTTLEEK
jgi:uncharacterized peroxidase-related enzyme